MNELEEWLSNAVIQDKLTPEDKLRLSLGEKLGQSNIEFQVKLIDGFTFSTDFITEYFKNSTASA